MHTAIKSSLLPASDTLPDSLVELKQLSERVATDSAIDSKSTDDAHSADSGHANAKVKRQKVEPNSQRAGRVAKAKAKLAKVKRAGSEAVASDNASADARTSMLDSARPADGATPSTDSNGAATVASAASAGTTAANFAIADSVP